MHERERERERESTKIDVLLLCVVDHYILEDRCSWDLNIVFNIRLDKKSFSTSSVTQPMRIKNLRNHILTLGTAYYEFYQFHKLGTST